MTDLLLESFYFISVSNFNPKGFVKISFL